jgi:hypothetical protein
MAVAVAVAVAAGTVVVVEDLGAEAVAVAMARADHADPAEIRAGNEANPATRRHYENSPLRAVFV